MLRFIEGVWVGFSGCLGVVVSIWLMNRIVADPRMFGTSVSLVAPAVAVPAGMCATLVSIVVGAIARAFFQSLYFAFQAWRSKPNESGE